MTHVVTGATSGIGLEISRGLAKAGEDVIMVGRNRERTEAALKEVVDSTGSDRVQMQLANLENMAEVRSLAERIPQLHVLVNNAAYLTSKREFTSEGVERMFAVNHLAPFYLAKLLAPKLAANPSSQIINIASNAHCWVDRLDFDNLQQEKGFSLKTAYGMQKLMNIMHAFEFSRRHAAEGMRANAHHPGEVATNLGKRGPLWLRIYWKTAARFWMRSAEDAAVPLVKAALAADGPTGQYFDKGEEAEPIPAAFDKADAKRLWEVSEEILAKILS